MSDRRTLYPEILPYRTGFLEAGGGHKIYFEDSGNPLGQPAIFLHGGHAAWLDDHAAAG